MLVPVKENELLALNESFRCAPNGEREQLLGAARFQGWKPPFPNEPLSEEGLELPILLQVAANMANGVDPTLGSSCDHKNIQIFTQGAFIHSDIQKKSKKATYWS